MSFLDLPKYLKIAYVFAWLLIVFHMIVLAAVVYWQIFDPTNLVFKTWLKGIMHLGTFDSLLFAITVFVVIWIMELVALFVYISWMHETGKKCYYVVAALIIVGIWTYMLVPALILLGLMMHSDSLLHFGMTSFEDLF
ncbi:hypothetical protein COV16_02335 [Candidatus Woesearchaeota archaeon CG10_big_fil_rev_8_21_14_0_10_34_8]|nr:MAG: hypothetical protein COV16_02335 [Candidatus Woesearchaeota archaeon CG10_big_fil_rev_8_21_14_0_10_34_8]